MSNDPQGECPKCRTPNSYTHAFCLLCGERLPWNPRGGEAVVAAASPGGAATAVAPVVELDESDTRRMSPKTAMIFRRIGHVMMYAGGFLTGYYWFIFNPAVRGASTDEVGNLVYVLDPARSALRQNCIYVGISLMVLGAILTYIGRE